MTPTMLVLLPIVLRVGSNVLMTFARHWHLKYWHLKYWHLKFPGHALGLVILISWGIAFFEDCLAVPANRIGYGTYAGQQLKVIQEVITLTVFAAFSVFNLGEALRWNHFAAMLCLVAAVGFMCLPGKA
jgi:uncharacterized protein (DUF486 family)